MTQTPSPLHLRQHRPLFICVLGAESSGKTQLVAALAQQARAQGLCVAVVDEYLRQWCVTQGRTPQQDEQAFIAAQQNQAIVLATDNAHLESPVDWVLADTSALMTAVYSEHYFADPSLYPEALAQQRQFDLTLLMGLDLPWQPDGNLRDGPATQAAVDALLRQALTRAGLGFYAIYGQGAARAQNAWAAIKSVANDKAVTTPLATPGVTQVQGSSYNAWQCACCGDPQCERRLFTERLSLRAAGHRPL